MLTAKREETKKRRNEEEHQVLMFRLRRDEPTALSKSRSTRETPAGARVPAGHLMRPPRRASRVRKSENHKIQAALDRELFVFVVL